ncbi:MAG TPA: gamma carbonic anhydrase family protein [Planctomycetes bacterium]|nr:gamma carbonic anhydrase family protein [Planctomycetota bacterium]
MRTPLMRVWGEAYVADNATIVADVTLGVDASVWFGTVIRGDVAPIRIGARTNVQDLTMIHPQHDEPVEVGDEVTIGHAAVIHCRVVESRCLIGIKAVLLPGAVIGEGSLVAAGALVTQGVVIPPRSLVMGAPAKVVRQVTDEEYASFLDSAHRYVEYARRRVES